MYICEEGFQRGKDFHHTWTAITYLSEFWNITPSWEHVSIYGDHCRQYRDQSAYSSPAQTVECPDDLMFAT